MIERVIEELQRHRRLLLVSHDPLDGDAIGSEIGMRGLLEGLGKVAVIVNPGPVPGDFLFLPGSDSVRAFPDGLEEPCDALVALDCGSRDRIHPVGDALASDTPLINIDHHEDNHGYGTLDWTDPSYGAVGQMVYDLALHADVPVSEEMAIALYVAIVTDTGRFGFSNTTARVHRMAEELIGHGVRPDLVHRHLYRQKSRSRMQIEAMAIAAMRTELGGRIAWTTVTQAMCREAGIRQEDAPDIVEIPASLEGVEVAVLFREMADGRGTRVSFRANGPIRVSPLARRYGGGGHPMAAGCAVCEPIGAARERIIADLVKRIVESTP